MKKIKKILYKIYFYTRVWILVHIFRKDRFEALYSGHFFKQNIEHSKRSARLLVEYLLQQYQIQSVLDIGCGNGIYLHAFLEAGVADVTGIDGSPNAKETALVDGKYIEIRDLSAQIEMNKSYDLVMTIEVAEHLDEKDADTFVANLCRHGNRVYFSAAHPGQGGTHHVNEQPKEYWIEKFKQHGFELQEQVSTELATYLEKENAVFWLHKNGMIFEKK